MEWIIKFGPTDDITNYIADWRLTVEPNGYARFKENETQMKFFLILHSRIHIQDVPLTGMLSRFQPISSLPVFKKHSDFEFHKICPQTLSSRSRHDVLSTCSLPMHFVAFHTSHS